MLTFGPVPSRRLGRSLGINNIPPKSCTYSCVYCQLGKTRDMAIERRAFHRSEDIFGEARERVASAADAGERVDYLTFVPDGEPTLDVDLGREIGMLRDLGIRIAVISNSSLIWMEDVRGDLCGADWVSLKIDTVDEVVWRKVNRPARGLDLDRILGGMCEFSREFSGKLVTETMLVKDVNDGEGELERTAERVAEIGPSKSYISMPIRPPSEGWVECPDEEVLVRAYDIFRERGLDVEHIIGYEGNAFASTGDAGADLLSITSVHPMREDAVAKFLEKNGADWVLVEALIGEGELKELVHGGRKFYIRNLERERLGRGDRDGRS